MQSQSPTSYRQRTTPYPLQTALIDFNRLKQINCLPQKMLIKLQYLQSHILKLPLSTDHKQLPQYELNSLQQCDYQSKVKLFVSIVKCLSGKEVIVYVRNEKVYWRKDQVFSIWHKGYINTDSNRLWIRKKPDQIQTFIEFKIKNIKISKKYMNYKDKMCFGLMHKDDKYMIGFQQETACARIFKTLKQLIKQTNSNEKLLTNQISQQYLPTQSSISLTPRKVLNPSQQSKFQFTSNIRKNSQNLQQQQQIQVDYRQLKGQYQRQLILQQIKKQQFSSDNGFKLQKNFQLGRVLIATQQQNSFSTTKISLLLNNISQQMSFQFILQQYLINMDKWNLQVEKSMVVNRVGNNSYKMFIKFKKYSMVSYPRWVYLTVTAISIHQKVYLLVRTCEHLTQEELSQASITQVRMTMWNQTVEFCKRTQNDDKILMTIITQADFGGYCSKNDNLNMSLHILMNMNDFYNFLFSQNIHKQQSQNSPNSLFQFAQIQRRLSVPTNKSSTRKSQESSQKSSVYQQGLQQKLSIKNQIKLFSQVISSNTPARISNLASIRTSNLESNRTSNRTQNIKQNMKQNMSQNMNENRIQTLSPNSLTSFLNLLSSYQQNWTPSQQFLSLLSSSYHHSHYLTHKFILQSKYDPNTKRYNSDQDDNWLIQKGKWRISQSQVVFMDQDKLKEQKNVIKYILKQISTNVMAGKSIMNMSLPVQIFQDKSFLEKCAEAFGFLPLYFQQAAQQKDVVKQIQLVAKALSYSISVCPNIQKPFNPILGQTYQCKLGGINLYLQQICHHPPISAYYMKTQSYEFSGSFHPHIDMGLNTVLAKNYSPSLIKFFSTNTHYQSYSQDFQISGLMFGDRKLRSAGKFILLQTNSEVLCEISYGKAKKNVYQSKNKIKSGDMIGGIYKVTNSFVKRLHNTPIKNFDGVKSDEVIEEYAKIRGNWLGQFYLNNIKSKDRYDPIPFCPVKQLYLLPSDCSYRLDCYYKRQNDLKKAQQNKQIYQNLQRKDRKMRQQSGSSH